MRMVAKRILRHAQHWMEHRPIAANSILCFSLWVAGDSLAQYSEYKMKAREETMSEITSATAPPPEDDDDDTHSRITTTTKEDKQGMKEEERLLQSSTTTTTWSPAKLDLVRTGQCASYGAFITGPLIALWYPWLEKFSQRTNHPWNHYKIWGGPVFKVVLDQFVMDPPTILAFFGYMTVCEGGDLETFQQKVQQEFWTTWLTSMAVWPVVLLGTFRFLPIYAQAPMINVCAIVWDAFLSNRNAAARIQQQQQAAEAATTLAATKEVETLGAKEKEGEESQQQQQSPLLAEI